MKAIEINEKIASAAERLNIEVGSVSFDLVRIPAGVFMMGASAKDPDAQANEFPARRITISKSFYLGQYEVTQAQYQEVMGENPSSRIGSNLPVHELTTAKALAFCHKLSALTGVNVTLPTEAQWEYACHAGTNTRFNLGDGEEDLARAGWYRENSAEDLHPVGQKKPNAWGLYDMHGNVTEICLDLISSYVTVLPQDPVGVIDENRSAMRGGGFMHDAALSRCSARMVATPRFGGAGMRIVINP